VTRIVPVHSAGGPPLASDVAASLAAQRTLGDVTTWSAALAPPRAIDEIVTQDEYTHDVVMRFAPDCWLVYDTT
jgi:hypothetical protein